jgi:hypothetical protein
MDKLQALISYWHIWLGAVTAQQWYTFGAILGASGVLVGIISWVKRRQLRKHLDKLEDWVITLNLWFYSVVLNIGAFVGLVVGFGVDPAMFLSFFGNHWSDVIVFATGLYAFSKGAKQYLAKRRASKIHITDQLIDGIVDTPVTEVSNPLPTEVPTPVTTRIQAQPRQVDATMWRRQD